MLRPFPALDQAVLAHTSLTQDVDDASSTVGSGESQDIWQVLSEQWWTPWAMLVVALALGLWMIRSLVLHRGRVGQIQAAATASGMAFQTHDGAGLSSIKFQHFPSGTGRGWSATNVVTLRSSDGDTRGFDSKGWVDMAVSDSSGRAVDQVRRPQTKRLFRGPTGTGAVAVLPINAPRMLVTQENLASKLFTAATRLDLDVESGLFNRSYHVVCSDRRFAETILDARMVDLMVQTEGRVSFEFFGRYLLLATVQLEPELVPGLVRLADQMRRVVSPLAIDRWPSADLLDID